MAKLFKKVKPKGGKKSKLAIFAEKTALIAPGPSLGRRVAKKVGKYIRKKGLQRVAEKSGRSKSLEKSKKDLEHLERTRKIKCVRKGGSWKNGQCKIPKSKRKWFKG